MEMKWCALDAEKVFFQNRGKVLSCSTARTQLEFTKYTPRHGTTESFSKLQRTLEFVLFFKCENDSDGNSALC